MEKVEDLVFELQGEYSQNENIKNISEWVLEQPVTVTSVDGEITEETSFVKITLSNGDTVTVDSHFEAGPPDSYYEGTGKRNPNYANISINDNVILNVYGSFLDNLAEYGSIVLTGLHYYKNYYISLKNK